MKRHTCIICKKKRYENRMTKVLTTSWACNDKCIDHKDIEIAIKIKILYRQLKVLNRQHIFAK